MEKRITLFLVFFCGFATAQAEPVSLTSPTGEWSRVFKMLTTPGALSSAFEELRDAPLLKKPRPFAGTIRWDPTLGLSIAYTEPTPQVVCIADGVMVIKKPKQPLRVIRGKKHQGVMLLFNKLFQWDAAWLAKHFTTTGSLLDEGRWTLALTPVDKDTVDSVQRIDLKGNGSALTAIYVDLRGGRSIAIALSPPIRKPRFSDEEIAFAFPASDDE